MLEFISRVKRQLSRAVSAWVLWSAPKPICMVMTGRRMAPWQRSALHQPTVLLSPFSRMTLLKHHEHMLDRHRKTCSDNVAVISKHVPWQHSSLGFYTNSRHLHSLRHCLLSWTGSANSTFTRLACLQERGAHPDDPMRTAGWYSSKCLKVNPKEAPFVLFFFCWDLGQNWHNTPKACQH